MRIVGTDGHQRVRVSCGTSPSSTDVVGARGRARFDPGSSNGTKASLVDAAQRRWRLCRPRRSAVPGSEPGDRGSTLVPELGPARMAQLGGRLSYKQEIAGSIPALRTCEGG